MLLYYLVIERFKGEQMALLEVSDLSMSFADKNFIQMQVSN